MHRPATAPDLLLDVKDLHAGYGRAEVLHGLNLHAKPGSVVTVIGPNGSGKSTLLNALMGVLPARGSIEYLGRSLLHDALEERVLAGMALVPETRELFDTMSVEDNLLLGSYRLARAGHRAGAGTSDATARAGGAEPAAGDARASRHNVSDAADVYALFPRLRERRKQLAGTLSGGERQMLAIGRALMGRPTLLMLDEPSLGLAPLVARDIFRTVEGLRACGVTILLVEQNARAALSVADHAYVLEMGEFVLEGPAHELAVDRRVIETYLGASRK
ncbi:MAG: ABC transporter ATP-binding protein [Variovorax sp.]